MERIDYNKVPLDIYQTWHTKELPPGMMNSVIRLRKDNPEFKYHLYDDNDCKEFIKEHFNMKVYDTFENLIPGAYKADLWRYCVLFKKGGVYLDIKFHTNNFKLIELVKNNKDYFVKDRDAHWEKGKIGIYNGFMVAKPMNPIFYKAIEKIVNNVNTGTLGLNALYPTGPGLLGSYFNQNTEFELSFSLDAKYIEYNQRNILKMYDNYRQEQQQNQLCPHYSELWAKKLVYKNAFNLIKLDYTLLMDILMLKNIKTFVPLNIFQVCMDQQVTKKVTIISEKIKKKAFGFGYFLFTLYDCGEFIRKNYEFKIYKTFTKLKCLKNKIDLWKYCVLYKNGGFYIDINFNITDNFNFPLFLYKNYYLKDDIGFIVPDLIITEKGNKKILNCINEIVKNVNQEFYGNDWSDLTGSFLLTKQFNKKDLDTVEISMADNKIYYDDYVIIDSIDEQYYKIQEDNKYLWELKKLY